MAGSNAHVIGVKAWSPWYYPDPNPKERLAAFKAWSGMITWFIGRPWDRVIRDISTQHPGLERYCLIWFRPQEAPHDE